MSTVIKVTDLSKIYRLGEIGTGTISRDLERWYKMKIKGQEDPFLKIGQTNQLSKKGASDVVCSLRDINFEVQQGEALGIIGKNGAGKSTLLKIISRVTSPTTGKINIKGRVASLLEVGTGFHPELTGRENIYLNGAILGMRKKEITSKLDQIVDFSGVERYIDTPVKRYSSGMYVRLAFAVAAHLDTEILIIDEVLAVGDADFQQKAMGKMQNVSKSEGRTVLFVSHNMAAVKKLCDNAIMLFQGQLSEMGDVQKIINKYLNNVEKYDILINNIDEKYIENQIDGIIDNPSFIKIHSLCITGNNMLPRTEFLSIEEINLIITLSINFVTSDFRVICSIVDFGNRAILYTQLSDSFLYNGHIEPGNYSIKCVFPSNFFGTNIFKISLNFISVKKEHLILNSILKFKVKYENPNYIYGSYEEVMFRPNFNWQINQL